jgi:hypothetical protein
MIQSLGEQGHAVKMLSLLSATAGLAYGEEMASD